MSNFLEMNRAQLTEIAFKAMGSRKAHMMREKGYAFYHGQRTARLALELKNRMQKKFGVGNDIIYAGALFHDIAKGIEPHAHNGAVIVRHLLQKRCSLKDIDAITRIIEWHNKRKKTADLPAHIRLIQDADILDHVGSMEVWLTFSYGFHKSENTIATLEYWKSPSYRQNIRRMQALLNFAFSNEIFKERVAFSERFINRFALETKGKLNIPKKRIPS
jgi:uncharacterized protein